MKVVTLDGKNHWKDEKFHVKHQLNPGRESARLTAACLFPDLETLAEYTSPGENPALWAIFPVTLGNPGRKMLAMPDSNNRTVELVGIKDRQLTEESIFEVFQDPGFREPESTYEPHDVGTGDFNGDNIRDMAILVHDKLIIYLGE
jgi:hypothetical protein